MTTPRAKTRRRRVCRDSPVDDSVENKDSLEDALNSHVEIPYDVLTIIFKNLNAKDLCNAAQVSRCWREAASIEKRIRVAGPLILSGKLVNSWRNLSPEKPFVDNVMTKPLFGFVFTQLDLLLDPALGNEECHCRSLPSKCSFLKVGSNGVVDNHLEFRMTRDAVLLLMPHDNEISIDIVYNPLAIPKPKTRARNRRNDTADDDWAFVQPDPGEKYRRKIKKYPFAKKKVKCFVLLSDEDLPHAANILDVVPSDDQRTISGCIAGNLKLCKNSDGEKFCSKSLGWIAMIISGASVRSWTAVLPSSLRTKEKVLEKLEKLREKVVLQKHTVAFMFACEGRGERMFREPNVEASIFKQLFPEVPLVGCAGAGEYGNCSIQRMTRLDHQYSTVFMIVTYGKLSKSS